MNTSKPQDSNCEEKQEENEPKPEEEVKTKACQKKDRIKHSSKHEHMNPKNAKGCRRQEKQGT